MILNIFKYLEAQTNLTHLIEFSNEFQWNLIITWNQQNRSTFKCIKPLREAGGDLWVRVGVPPNPILTRSEFILFWQTGDRRQERHQNKLKYKWLPPPPRPSDLCVENHPHFFDFSLLGCRMWNCLPPHPLPPPFLWKCMRIYENTWKAITNTWEFMKSMKMHEYTWESMKIYENK